MANPGEVKRLSKELILANRANPSIRSRMAHGTLSLVITNTASGVFGGLNYRYNWDPELPKQLDPLKYWDTFVTKRLGCAGCPTHCLHAYEVKEGPFAGTIGEKLEYGTVAALGTQIGVKDYGASGAKSSWYAGRVLGLPGAGQKWNAHAGEACPDGPDRYNPEAQEIWKAFHTKTNH